MVTWFWCEKPVPCPDFRSDVANPAFIFLELPPESGHGDPYTLGLLKAGMPPHFTEERAMG